MKGIAKVKTVIFSLTIFLSILNIINAQNFTWAKSFGAKRVLDMSVDNSKNLISVGWFGPSADFDPNAGVFTLTSFGSTQDAFVQKLDSSGSFIWAVRFGNSSNVDIAQAVTTDILGNVYVTGMFDGTVDFDPGAGIFNLSSNGGNGDIFVVKLDASGNFIWAKALGSPHTESATCINLDNSNNVIIGGGFQSTVDFDPGPGIFTITSVGTTSAQSMSQEGYILKLNNSGNFIWAGSIATGGFSPVRSLKTDNSGNIFACGNFSGTKDFDMGPGSYTMTATSSGSAYIMKVSPSGSFVWAKASKMGPLGQANALDMDAFGNVYATGNYALQFSMGLGTTTLATAGSNDIFILKLDNSGSFIWAKSVGTPSGYDEGTSICVDPSGNSYLTGYFGDTGDFDPNIGISNLTTTVITVFTLKLNSSGNFVWATSLGASNQAWAWAIARDNSSNIYTAGGYTGICDFNPGAGVFNLTPVSGENAFIQKLSQGVCSNMTMGFAGVSPVTCTSIGYATAQPIIGNAPYTFTWQSTASATLSNASFTAGGIYTVSATDALGCTRTSGILIGAPAFLSGFDVTGNLVTSNFRPSFGTLIKVDAFNNGCISTGGKVKLVLDNVHTLYTSSSPTVNSISGDTLIWNYSGLTSGSPHFTANVSVVTKTTSLVGDTVCMDLIITPNSGDAVPSNNFKTYCKRVVASYDPNDIQVNPAGACGLGYILKSQVLTYTIRFQNTGTAMASNIVVKDSLPAGLDINTLHVVGSSHGVYTEVSANGVLRFHFDNINLPDSGSNKLQSQGYVIYEINPLVNVANNTAIKNRAGIYFDFNPPVLTNTVSNIVVNAINCNSLTGTSEINKLVEYITIYPNPIQNELHVSSSSTILKLEVLNNIGQVVSVKSNIDSNQTDIDLSNLSKGIYFVQIQTASGLVSKKLIRE